MSHEGLAYCGRDWSDAFCIDKSIQFLVSLSTFILILHDFVVRFFREREFNFFFIVCIQMMIALLCNLFFQKANLIFTLDHHLLFFNYFEAFSFNIYFVTIVYQVALKLIKIKQSSQNFKLIILIINGCLIGFIVFLIVVLVLRIVYLYNDCQEVWFLLINFFGIILSIIMVCSGKIYMKHEQERIAGLIDKKIKNPSINVWRWIIINITCQLISFLQSLIFIISPLKCKFTENYPANQTIKLFFQLLSFHIGMIATIFFFRGKYNEDEESLTKGKYSSSVRDRIYTEQSKEIELTSNPTNSKTSNNEERVKKIGSFFFATKDKESHSILNAVHQTNNSY